MTKPQHPRRLPGPRAAYRVWEIALMLGVSEKLVRRMIDRGTIRAVRLEGVVAVPAGELARLMRDGAA